MAQSRFCAAAMALGGFSGHAFAEAPQDQAWAGLEYFLPTIRSTARLDATAPASRGRTVSLEDDLGFDHRKATPYVRLGARLYERWRIELEYYQLDRAST